MVASTQYATEMQHRLKHTKITVQLLHVVIFTGAFSDAF